MKTTAVKTTRHRNGLTNPVRANGNSILLALAATLRVRDAETQGHSERVVRFSLMLGQELDLDEDQLEALSYGSLLHDIGKIGVPDAILRKPGRLTELEWSRMREHPALGMQILSGIDSLAGASKVVAQHHERWDGNGYPFGLAGNEIDRNARIFAVADAFDAMTSERVYNCSKKVPAAADELQKYAGKQFDPLVVEAFLRIPQEEWLRAMREEGTEASKATRL